MRRHRVRGWAVVAALVLACSDPGDPAIAAVTGSYELIRHDGQPVPHLLTSRRCAVSVRWGSLMLRANGEFDLFVSYGGSCGGAPDSTYDLQAVDAYRFVDGHLAFPPEGLAGAVSATLRGSHFAVAFMHPLLDRRADLEFAPGPAEGVRIRDVDAEAPWQEPPPRGRIVVAARRNRLVPLDSVLR